VSETILDHGYIPEEHAPDPVVGHGDPTRPGKVGIWLFLASEIMFFIGILGTYIILRSSAPQLFAEHAHTLSKTLAGINTLVLIFSSLTMALAVDGAQKGDRNRTVLMLLLTLLCAAGFMGIKAKEYYDKFTHHTMLVKGPGPITVQAEPGQGTAMYAVFTNKAGELFTPDAGFEKKPPRVPAKATPEEKAANEQLVAAQWKRAAIPLAEQAGDAAGTYTATIPPGPDPDGTVAFYKMASAEPNPKDKAVKPTKPVKPQAHMYVYDGHVHAEGNTYHFKGYKMPYPAGGDFNINLISEPDVHHASGADKPIEETIAKASVTNDITYGPWKNNFYAAYFAATGIHGLHVVGGMIPIGLLMIFALRGKLLPHHTEYTGLYWHFVDLVWIFLFPLLYLI
jgi:cytochrome c oxidase subunit 3